MVEIVVRFVDSGLLNWDRDGEGLVGCGGAFVILDGRSWDDGLKTYRTIRRGSFVRSVGLLGFSFSISR